MGQYVCECKGGVWLEQLEALLFHNGCFKNMIWPQIKEK